MDQPAFKHQPLADPANQIRLLEVISLPDMPMELSLSVHEITKDSDYYAISYTWGDSCFTKEIIINGRPMMVTENCHYALTQVRDRYPSLHGTSIFIWIDSICINQNDNDEKSDQVAMMGNIYTRASKVLACIGPHQDNSHMIRNMLDSVVRLSPELYSLREEFPLKNNTGQPRFSTVFNNNDRLPQSKIEGFLEMYFRDSPTPRHAFAMQFIDAFTKFANRSYWSRVWIIQEVVATTRGHGQLEILCGCDVLSKYELNMCYFICGGLYKGLPADQRPRGGIYSYCCRLVLGSNASEPIPAGSILLLSRTFKCARPEDRVYGLLPLIKWPKGTTPVQPLYEPSPILDLAQLFVSIADWPDGDFWIILDALEVSHDHRLFRPMVEARMQRPPQPLGRGKYPPISFDFEATVMTICLNSHGQLSANLVRNDYIPPKDVNETEAELTGAPEGTRQLFAGSNVGALLCSDAQAGDKVVKVPVLGGLLVLRNISEESEYDIIGQGLLFSDHSLPLYPSRPPAGGELKEIEAYDESKYASCCKLEVEPIDYMVLERQDRGINGSRVEEKRLERLATKIYGKVKLIK
ncbi:hypothetical protein FOVG_04007 [Fusarium oxysporum f. sp. pisi HDV247]|uniref:Heterokaryon incompatibility domain-containing protein n=1 Tax=Fusarium oxysporum f. sp. pisi HDV247 TaxID=1080344 RepID=W9PWJ6_FUSOX|nr:hypothetical protein FOVG_04007 [Fusarium oxysporum f. sp. pisi HDV247]